MMILSHEQLSRIDRLLTDPEPLELELRTLASDFVYWHLSEREKLTRIARAALTAMRLIGSNWKLELCAGLALCALDSADADAHLERALQFAETDDARADAKIEISRQRARTSIISGRFADAYRYLSGAPRDKFVDWSYSTLLCYLGSAVFDPLNAATAVNYGTPARIPPSKLWNGSDISGKTVLIAHGGGYGDYIQFIRYAPIMKVARGAARVIATCRPHLVELIATVRGIDQLVRDDSGKQSAYGRYDPAVLNKIEYYDCGVELFGLPRVFRTRVDTVPADVPYIFPPQERIEAARQLIGSEESFKIGVAWRASSSERSFPLKLYWALAAIPGVRIFGLQCEQDIYRDGAPSPTVAEEIAACGFPITNLEAGASDAMRTAANMCALDLIVAPDTFAAHLAGALARPVLMITPHVHDFRWLQLERTDSPWYPTMRLFRQPSPGDWAGALSQVTGAVREIVGGRI